MRYVLNKNASYFYDQDGKIVKRVARVYGSEIYIDLLEPMEYGGSNIVKARVYLDKGKVETHYVLSWYVELQKECMDELFDGRFNA